MVKNRNTSARSTAKELVEIYLQCSSLTNFLNPWHPPADISAAQLSVLLLIYDRKSLTLSTLSKESGVPDSELTILCRKLSLNEYVKNDRHNFVLTAKGESVARIAHKRFFEMLFLTHYSLPTTRQKQFVDCLLEVIRIATHI